MIVYEDGATVEIYMTVDTRRSEPTVLETAVLCLTHPRTPMATKNTSLRMRPVVKIVARPNLVISQMQNRPNVRYWELRIKFKSNAPCSERPACSKNWTVCTLIPLPPQVWAI